MQIEATNIRVKAFYHSDTFSLSYVVQCLDSSEAVIIDPVLDYEPNAARLSSASVDEILNWSEENALNVTHVLETHVHADHVSAARYINQKTNATIAIGKNVETVQQHFNKFYQLDDAEGASVANFDQLLADGEQIKLGDDCIRIIATPGHTPACVSYYIAPFLFVGDTLFAPDYGTARCDFPGGDAAELFRSVKKIYQLPDDTVVCLCHDYQPNGRPLIWQVDLTTQKQTNIHLNQSTSEAEFVTMRQSRDATLSVPKLILPAIQLNIKGGITLDATQLDGCMLKIPINRL